MTIATKQIGSSKVPWPSWRLPLWGSPSTTAKLHCSGQKFCLDPPFVRSPTYLQVHSIDTLTAGVSNFVPFWGSVNLEGVHSLLWCFTNMDCRASAAYSSNQPCRHQALESNASASSLGWTSPKWVQWGQEKGYRKGSIPRKKLLTKSPQSLPTSSLCCGSEAPTAPHRTGCRDSLKGSEVLVLHLGPLDDSLDWFKGKSTGNHGFYHQI